MAGRGNTNFDKEIKKGMKGGKGGEGNSPPVAAKSSTNAAPLPDPSQASGQYNQPAPPVQNMPQDTGKQMMDAGHAHMAAIHNHVNSMRGGG